MNKSITLNDFEIQYIDSVFIKNYKQTLNNIIETYRSGAARLDANKIGRLDKGVRQLVVRFDKENADFINNNMIINVSFTVRAIINFLAKQNTN